jgi:hypothetical protein
MIRDSSVVAGRLSNAITYCESSKGAEKWAISRAYVNYVEKYILELT